MQAGEEERSHLLGGVQGGLARDAARYVARQRALCDALLRCALHSRFERPDLLMAQKREESQEATDVAVLGREPELVERVRRRPCCVEPDSPGLRLSKLGAGRAGHERNNQALRFT